MKAVRYGQLGLLVLLSISTGVTKLVQMPEEMALFRNFGFSDTLTILFGVVQVLGGLLLVPSRTRRVGAIIMRVTFVVATAAVFSNAMPVFGLFSLLFIAAAVFHVRYPQIPRSIAATRERRAIDIRWFSARAAGKPVRLL